MEKKINIQQRVVSSCDMRRERDSHVLLDASYILSIDWFPAQPPYIFQSWLQFIDTAYRDNCIKNPSLPSYRRDWRTRRDGEEIYNLNVFFDALLPILLPAWILEDFTRFTDNRLVLLVYLFHWLANVWEFLSTDVISRLNPLELFWLTYGKFWATTNALRQGTCECDYLLASLPSVVPLVRRIAIWRRKAGKSFSGARRRVSLNHINTIWHCRLGVTSSKQLPSDCCCCTTALLLRTVSNNLSA